MKISTISSIFKTFKTKRVIAILDQKGRGIFFRDAVKWKKYLRQKISIKYGVFKSSIIAEWYIDPILIINLTILSDLMQKSNKNFLSPIAPSLSPVKSQTDINKTTLCQLFSKQFLGRVKQQLQVKSPKSKPIQPQSKQLLLQLKSQKQQIIKLKQIIENLTKQNQELQKKLDKQEGKQEEQSIPQMIVHHPKLTRKLSIMKTQNGNSLEEKDNNAEQQEKQIEIQGLKGKIQKLETLKSIKDQRINQLLEKQLRFTSQIKLLQHKNQQLKEELYVLRSTIQYTLQKPLKNTTNSQIDPSISIKPQPKQQSPTQHPPLPSGLLSINNHQDSSLIVSCTANIMIPDSLTLSKAYKKFQKDSCSSFNQIDYMISQELPYVTCSSEISLEGMNIKPQINLNQSLIAINLNQF